MADFDTLINLITSTIAPDSWDEVGGAGAIEPFPTGVYVDSSGLMKRLSARTERGLLSDVRKKAAADSGNRDVSRPSALRKVSLTRLERQAQLAYAFGKEPSAAMRSLAGIYEIEHLFVYPDSGDIVIAGPAGDTRKNHEGRLVNVETGTPVLQLDDLVVVLRNAQENKGRMGCAIKPRTENLAAVKHFVDSWQGRSLKPYQRDEWMAELRATLGEQDIEVWGIDPRSQVARILIEADYHMKLIGVGLEPGTLGVESYLKTLQHASGDHNIPMTILRWWFTLNYECVRTTPDRTAYQLDGTGVRVLSENELLTEKGERIHTGASSELNSQFAHSFTKHFASLADKYPIYAELKNIFDMALVAGIIHAEDLPTRTTWDMTHFGTAGDYHPQLGAMPVAIASIMNSVNVNEKRFLIGISGGVSIDPQSLLEPKAVKVDSYGLMDAAHHSAAPTDVNSDRLQWWWD